MDEAAPEAPNRDVRVGARVLTWALIALLIAVVAAVAVPAYLRWAYSRGWNPRNSLRSLVTAQEQFKAQVVVDQDGNQVGEYGWLGELTGCQRARVSGVQLNTSPFIAAILGVKDAGGWSQKSGQYYRMWMQSADGSWQPEPAGPTGWPNEGGGAPFPEDPAAARYQEKRWICYAWPNVHGHSGNAAYVITQAGRMWKTEYEPGVGAGGPYNGTTNTPAGLAAFTADGSRIADGAKGERGQDGRLWMPAGR